MRVIRSTSCTLVGRFKPRSGGTDMRDAESGQALCGRRAPTHGKRAAAVALIATEHTP